jgi:hypothetical protein
MHRDARRDAEIEEEIPFELRGEMAVVADPDCCGDWQEHEQDDEELPDTIREAPSSALLDQMDHERASAEGMTPSSALMGPRDRG